MDSPHGSENEANMCPMTNHKENEVNNITYKFT